MRSPIYVSLSVNQQMMPHLLLLVIAALLFVAVQAWVVIKLLQWRRQFLETIEWAKRSPTSVDAPDWFRSFYASSSNQTHVTAAREIALQQLEAYIYSRPSFLLLQKASIAAPLVGVLFTAFGFMTISGDFQEFSSLTIPLVSGVATGALLALVNQGVLQWCEVMLEHCRLSGQKLLDHVWLSKISGHDPVSHLSLVAHRFNATTESFANLVGEFPDDVGELTKRFDRVARMSEKTFEVLNRLLPTLKATSSAWEESSRRLQDAANNGLVQSLGHIKMASDLLSNAANNIGDLLSAVDSSAKSLSESAALNKELSGSIRGMVQQSIDQVHKRNAAWIDELERNVNDLSAPLNAIAAGLANVHLSSLSDQLDLSRQLLGEINGAVKTFNQYLIQEIIPLSKSAQELSGCVKNLEVITANQIEASKSLGDVVNLRAIPTADVLLRATGTFEDASHSIAESGYQLSEVVSKLQSMLEESGLASSRESQGLDRVVDESEEESAW